MGAMKCCGSLVCIFFLVAAQGVRAFTGSSDAGVTCFAKEAGTTPSRRGPQRATTVQHAALLPLDGLDTTLTVAGVAAGVAGAGALRRRVVGEDDKTAATGSSSWKTPLLKLVKKPQRTKNAALKRMRLAELREYDGRSPQKPLYVGADGLIFDVSSAAHLYGPGGAYASFAGRDASRRLAKGTIGTIADADADESSSSQSTPLSLGERAALKAWVAALRTKYPVVAALETKTDLDLIDAARAGDAKDVARLLRSGADVHAVDAAGDAALHAAAEAGDADCCALLVDAGADLGLRGSRGRAPVHFAAEADDAAALLELLRRGADPRATALDDWTPAHSASQHGRVAQIVALVDAGALVDAPSAAGVTPLIAAATFGHVAVVRYLLCDAAADASRAVRGKTALDWARQKGHRDVVAVLEDHHRDAAAGTTKIDAGAQLSSD